MSSIRDRVKSIFKIPGLNQGPNATSEYYEQLLNDPHVNKLKFSDDDPEHSNNPKSLNNPAPEYHFSFNDFEELETIAATRHIIKKMRHKPSKTVLAVKFVHIPHNRHSSDEDALKKLKQLVREVQNFRLLRNEPNIVKFYGCCLYEHQALICMELMDLSLKDLSSKFLKNGEKFPEELLNCVIVAVLKALAACKAKNIIHRDVKPDNVLLSKNGAIKLIDFGESRVLENSMASTFAGDLSYWPPERFEAPEQSETKTGPDQSDTNAASDQPSTVASPELPETLSQPVEPAGQSNQASTPTTKKFDVRADVWSLGITLIEIVHGSVPYRDKKGLLPNNIILLQNLILKLDPVATVDKHLDGYTKEIKDFVKSCLKKVNDRPKYNDLMKTPFYKNRETIDSETIVKNLIEKHYPID